jgi:hypothetical protein
MVEQDVHGKVDPLDKAFGHRYNVNQQQQKKGAGQWTRTVYGTDDFMSLTMTG